VKPGINDFVLDDEDLEPTNYEVFVEHVSISDADTRLRQAIDLILRAFHRSEEAASRIPQDTTEGRDDD
jgi:hypothetical protein